MPYIHRRKKENVDLLIEAEFKVAIDIRDSVLSDRNNTYAVTIGSTTVAVQDTTPGADDSAQIATDLATALNNSGIGVEAHASGNILEIRPEEYDAAFKVVVSTTNPHAVLTQQKVFAEAYQILNAPNWDGTFTELVTIPRRGYRSRATTQEVEHNQSAFGKWVRFRFNPHAFGLDDNETLFLRVVSVYGGVPTTKPGRIVTIPPPAYYNENVPFIVLQGTAPPEGTEILLPEKTRTLEVRNIDTAATAYLSFRGSGEIPLGPGETFEGPVTGAGYIRIRSGDGAGAEVYVVAGIRHNVII